MSKTISETFDVFSWATEIDYGGQKVAGTHMFRGAFRTKKEATEYAMKYKFACVNHRRRVDEVKTIFNWKRV